MISGGANKVEHLSFFVFLPNNPEKKNNKKKDWLQTHGQTAERVQSSGKRGKENKGIKITCKRHLAFSHLHIQEQTGWEDYHSQSVPLNKWGSVQEQTLIHTSGTGGNSTWSPRSHWKKCCCGVNTPRPDFWAVCPVHCEKKTIFGQTERISDKCVCSFLSFFSFFKDCIGFFNWNWEKNLSKYHWSSDLQSTRLNMLVRPFLLKRKLHWHVRKCFAISLS